MFLILVQYRAFPTPKIRYANRKTRITFIYNTIHWFIFTISWEAFVAFYLLETQEPILWLHSIGMGATKKLSRQNFLFRIIHCVYVYVHSDGENFQIHFFCIISRWSQYRTILLLELETFIFSSKINTTILKLFSISPHFSNYLKVRITCVWDFYILILIVRDHAKWTVLQRSSTNQIYWHTNPKLHHSWGICC